MRLDKIKIAGFKSFVDPCVVLFPTNLTGVVGPNGCGKSNVIDAVRWVMGESSAKMLRGESMMDVIFNGSSTRKPIGKATVELIFDNSDGGVGGEYASYNTISVKRQVTREGQSFYFMNGTKCRRRDIKDLFLGTGLGPRSYSIIEQGMISRLIEARPEDMRVFIEEAAGISKYKERRKETERRIKNTRENLDRLNDLKDEVAKQLSHLERQAKTATKYKNLKHQERTQKAELLALQWHEMDLKVQDFDQQLSQLETALQAEVAKQRHLEAEIEQQRETHHQVNENFNDVQGAYYSAGADIARLEQSIQFNQQSQQRQQTELTDIMAELSQAQILQQQDKTKNQSVSDELAEIEPALEMAQAQEEVINERLIDEEQQLQEWQLAWDEFNHQVNEPSQRAQVERTKANHLEEQERQLKRRLQRLMEDQSRLQQDQQEININELNIEIQTLEQQLVLMRQQFSEGRQKIQQYREQYQQLHQQLNQQQSELQSAQGHLSSLETLQQDALNSGDKVQKQQDWLKQQQLLDCPRLAEHITVEKKWQKAIEIVLGDYLQALCIEQSSQNFDLETMPQGLLILLERSEPITLATDSLANQVQSKWALSHLLSQVHCCEDLNQAFQQRDHLAAGHYFVTSEGYCIGKNWFSIDKKTTGAGILEREQEIKQLKIQIKELQENIELSEQQRETAQQQQQQQEKQENQIRHQAEQIQQQQSQLKSRLAGQQARHEQVEQRLNTLQQEQNEIKQQLAQDQKSYQTSLASLNQALALIEEYAYQREDLEQQRETLNERLREVRLQTREQRDNVHELEMQFEALKTTEKNSEQNQQRLNEQLAQLEKRKITIESTLNQASNPLETQQEQLEIAVEKRLEVEQQLQQSRLLLTEIDHQMREKEQQRRQTEQAIEQVRSRFDQVKLKRQEILIHCKNYESQIKQMEQEPLSLYQQLKPEASIKEWQQTLVQIQQQISRLGSINLAAIDEFSAQSERLNYLQSQHDDIFNALTTLENVIQKIDKETKSRFKETFDKINVGVKILFPKLFGGGQAYIEMTGDDLLTSGVTVMARPPGKRNSSIHLLSGGEKALTAVALVFSIFQLNPAPFCMLDEVDAPLDDANVGRFSRLVKEMSDQVQFIFITHNKVTMEIANQLSGVTMHEPGVSRLVSVDIEEASQMAMM